MGRLRAQVRVSTSGRFQPGDHLQVRRRGLYHHHGIYISDDRVIQFGSGITLLDKSRTSVNAVSLGEFERAGAAQRVRHGYESWFGTGYHPPADEPWKVTERAEFMLKLQPKLPYNLVGHNCEHVANICVSRYWGESYQTRRWFGRKAAADAVVLWWMADRSRTNRPLPRWGTLTIAGWVVLGGAAIWTYNHQIKRFWQEIGPQWRQHEHALDDDPRNGLAE
jgi:Lecithin retinol acyltransferase